jgi:mannose/fructose/N-acetylgalactosamine-specific phosphotransferase system component IIC
MISKALILAIAFGLIACGEVRPDAVLLSCWGTVELIEGGQQVNPRGEKTSVSIAVDVANKILTIDDVQWPISGDTSRSVIVSVDKNRGNATLNRITGAVDIHFIESDMLRIFIGECKPAQKLF